MKKTLAVGTESFQNMVNNNRYYVDKTGFIKPLMESGSFVQLITRPRRFGKTLFLDTVRTFLEVNEKKPGDASYQQSLFSDLNILNQKDFCNRFMGQFPVLFISLRTVKGQTFDSAMNALAEVIQPIAENYASLIDSPRLSDDDKTFLRNTLSRAYLLNPAHRQDLSVFLSKLTSILARHFERQVVLLIDEYDVPLQKAAKADYYPAMLEFVQSFLSPLKSETSLRVNGRPALRKAILTGCLRVSKASIFTDVNNFDVNTVCLQGGSLATAFGFTESEVNDLLNYYDLADQKSVVKHWYDGYRFGNADIYCPWDVICFCNDIQEVGINMGSFFPENYWADTSSNDVIEEFLGFLSSEDADKMQHLLDGGSVELCVNEQLTYGDFKDHCSDDFWTLLLLTGYLTIQERLPGKNQCFRVRIPNEEIRLTFEKKIRAHFSKANSQLVNRGVELAHSFLSGNAENVRKTLLPLLRKYISVRDSATKAPPENYYHGFLTAMLACAGSTIENFHSNRESGNGFADLVFTSPDQDVGVIVEIKRCNKDQEMMTSAQKALAQIKTQNYVQELMNYDCRQLWGFGIAFYGKACVITVTELAKST
mgnify:CR=1 FL=1